MNSALPLTRRDVVALFIYVVLACNVLTPLLAFVSRFVLARLPWFQTPLLSGSGRYMESALSFGAALVFSLALLPFVSLIASGATGRRSAETVTRQSFFSLTFTCAGLMLLLMSLPQFGLMIGYYVLAPTLYGRSVSTVRSYLLQSVAAALVVLSLGFVLAFFPPIFGGLRARVRDEEFVA